MRNDNTYAQIWANHVSDCISDRNNLTTWDDFFQYIKGSPQKCIWHDEYVY